MNDLVRLAMPHIEKFENAKHREGWRIVGVTDRFHGPKSTSAIIVFEDPYDTRLRKEEKWELLLVDKHRIEAMLVGASLHIGGEIFAAPDALFMPVPMLLIELAGEEEP